MSDLLNQASLVMIPSGYKEDTVFSQLPQDGSGDLSFTRASDGTRINSQGLVEVVPWNLATNSENFSALYNGINATISNNTTSAPNATTTADSLLETTATDIHAIYADYTQQSGVQYTYSVYVKSISGRNVRISGSSGFGGPIALVDLSNGSLLSGSSGASVESVGNGWYRISLTATTTATTVRVIMYSMNGTSTTFAGSTSNGVYLWGAQLNIGSTAKPYFPTTDRLNVPRLTYQNGGGGCPSLLLEPQRTNLVLQSQDFDNASWTTFAQGAGVAAVITANVSIAPDGTISADRIQCNQVNSGSPNRSAISQTVSVISGVVYTFSLYVKSNTGTNQNFSVLNSALNASSGFSNQGIATNEWTRYIFQGTAASTGGNAIRIGLIDSVLSTSNDILIWGAQLEAGAYPTTYIPTTSSSATRVADVALKTSATALIGQTEGTLFADFVTGGLPSIDQYYMNISDGTTSNIVYIGFYSNILVARVIDAGSLVVNINVALATNTRYKVGFAYKTNDCILYINGSNSGSDTSASIPACSKLSYNDFSNEACYQLNESILFKTRLTNAELASLTTL